MTAPTLDELIARRAVQRTNAVAAAERAHRELLDVVLEAVGREGANVRDLAKRAGIARATIYNELERRAKAAEHGDAIEGNGHPPPAPADDDVDTVAGRQARGLEPIRAARRQSFTLIQSKALEALARLADARGHGDHLDRGERVEDVAAAINEERRRNVSATYVRRILRELAEGYSPAPVTAVAARRGRTNFRLTPLELARRAGTNNAGAAGS